MRRMIRNIRTGCSKFHSSKWHSLDPRWTGRIGRCRSGRQRVDSWVCLLLCKSPKKPGIHFHNRRQMNRSSQPGNSLQGVSQLVT